MDYFQGVVTEFLRADRSVFVNTEYLIQLDEGDKQFKDRHWYCDAIAVNFKEKAIYLCEISYSASLQSLMSRLQAWETNWQELNKSVIRDSRVPNNWAVRPWVFIPEKCRVVFDRKMALMKPKPDVERQMPRPRITYLESALPWEYPSWDRKHDALVGDA